MTQRIERVRDLKVYQLAFEVAMEIFELSKASPLLSLVHRPSSLVHRPSSIVYRPSSVIYR